MAERVVNLPKDRVLQERVPYFGSTAGMGCQSAPYGPAATHGRPAYGQGKRTTTIVADQGDVVTVVTDIPYSIRSRHNPLVGDAGRRGTRTMHRSTLWIPTQNYTNYITSSQINFGGSRFLGPAEQRKAFPSQHTSQICLGREDVRCNSDYKTTYVHKDVLSARKLNQQSFENKMIMAEGAGLKRVMTAPETESKYHYWSQYNRIHNKLGAMLGPGVPQDRGVRESYNPITGAQQGPDWQEDNRRISGNRILYHGSRRPDPTSQLLIH